MAGSVASTTQPSFIAASRYQGASIILVRSRSVVEVTIRIGHDRAGSNPFGKKSNARPDRKSTRLNSSHDQISYAVFCLKKKKKKKKNKSTNTENKIMIKRYEIHDII